MSEQKRAVCHLDANYYYGQIEALFRPEIRGNAFIVGGDQESRKGIVLTKSPVAFPSHLIFSRTVITS